MVESTRKLRELDDIDRQILNILSKNARSKLTKIAHDIRLSVDSTKKRLVRLERDVIRKYTIQIDDEYLGYKMGVHVYVKLKDVAKDVYKQFIDEMTMNPRVINLVAMLGSYDIYLVFVSKGPREMDEMKLDVRQRFGSIIGEWNEVVVSKIYKLEEYRF